MGKRTSLLTPFPRRTAYDDIRTALRGASYHLHQLKTAMTSMRPLTDAQGLRLEEVELFHWHLRAFFWELVAVRDVLKRSRSPLPDLAGKLDNERWFIEVTAYRNFTHKSLHIVEIMMVDNNPLAIQIQPALEGQSHEDGIPQLERYWQNMNRFTEENLHDNPASRPPR